MNSNRSFRDGLVSFYRQNRNIVLSYVAMIVLLAAVSIYRPGFGFGNIIALRSLAQEAAVIAIVSLGQTLVILSGGVDLSLPWTFAGSAVMMTVFTHGQDGPTLWAIPLILTACVVVGLINGLVISRLDVAPVIMTLAMSGILLGAVSGFGIGSTGVIYGTPPKAIIDLASNRFLEVPNLVWLTIGLVLIAILLLSFSGFGRRLYAIGTSRQVSLYSGVNIPRMTVLVYVISAVMGGIAGILVAGKLGQAYLGMGDSYLFISVAAVVIGGTSILGGNGHFIGTIGGALLLSVLTAAIPVLNLPRPFQLIVFGLVILFAVFFATNQTAHET
jgi:ribose transport system permease protein